MDASADPLHTVDGPAVAQRLVAGACRALAGRLVAVWNAGVAARKSLKRLALLGHESAHLRCHQQRRRRAVRVKGGGALLKDLPGVVAGSVV